jgi:hypothetical protein
MAISEDTVEDIGTENILEGIQNIMSFLCMAKL